MATISINEMLLELKLLCNSLHRRLILIQQQIQEFETFAANYVDAINEALIEESPSLSFKAKM